MSVTATPGSSSSSSTALPPAPEYILRGHEAQINTISFSDAVAVAVAADGDGDGGDADANLLFSGDADGYVGVWSLRTFRPLAFFKAHSGSVLTLASWARNTRLLTHGRDNKIHAFDLSAIVASSSASKGLPSLTNLTPLKPLFTLETNALGYCKCAVLQTSSSEALVAVPSTLDDSLVDIFHLPSAKRIHRSIGKGCFTIKTGTVMCLSLFEQFSRLRLLVAYEDGRVVVFSYAGPPEDLQRSPLPEENGGWIKSIEYHEHKEPIMGLCLDSPQDIAWSVSADHLVVRYGPLSLEQAPAPARTYKTAYPGRAAVSVRDDGRILAIAGWDGLIRVHSAASFKPLAVLEYHRDSLYSIAFQPSMALSENDAGNHASGFTPWLAAGGADHRISLWKIFPLS